MLLLPLSPDLSSMDPLRSIAAFSFFLYLDYLPPLSLMRLESFDLRILCLVFGLDLGTLSGRSTLDSLVSGMAALSLGFILSFFPVATRPSISRVLASHFLSNALVSFIRCSLSRESTVVILNEPLLLRFRQSLHESNKK